MSQQALDNKYTRGMVEQFVDDRDLVEKFEKLVRHVLPEQQMQKLRDAVLGLEQFADTAQLERLLTLVS